MLFGDSILFVLDLAVHAGLLSVLKVKGVVYDDTGATARAGRLRAEAATIRGFLA